MFAVAVVVCCVFSTALGFPPNGGITKGFALPLGQLRLVGRVVAVVGAVCFFCRAASFAVLLLLWRWRASAASGQTPGIGPFLAF